MESATFDAGTTGPRGSRARDALRAAAPRLSADQAEHALGRLREADYPKDDPTVAALLDRLETAGGKRRANQVRGWWGKAGDVAERRAQRAQVGTVAQQRAAYDDYVERLGLQLEAATRGQYVTARMRELQARGGGMSIAQILTSNPATMRKHLSEEALRELAKIGPPLRVSTRGVTRISERGTVVP